MRLPRRTSQFKKDVKLAARRGLDLHKLEAVLSALIGSMSCRSIRHSGTIR